MSFKSASNPNNKSSSSNNKASQIVGASLSNVAGSQVKRSYETKDGQKLSSIAPSDEFRAFWGNNVDPSWFEGKRPLSPFLIFIAVLIILNLYLCSRLIFAPGEFQQMFTSMTSPEELESTSKISKLQTFEDEKYILSEKESEKDKTEEPSAETEETIEEDNSIKTNKDNKSKKR
ncbi:MAG: hypothetical protein SFU25_08465 [Candidatus Caenarcaniphilales bacterium]|nr:hypothetical protein [Candidatus Caenarcaniphilales bacterium]